MTDPKGSYDEIRVFERASYTQGNVETFANHVYPPVAQFQFETHIWVSGEKTGQ